MDSATTDRSSQAATWRTCLDVQSAGDQVAPPTHVSACCLLRTLDSVWTGITLSSAAAAPETAPAAAAAFHSAFTALLLARGKWGTQRLTTPTLLVPYTSAWGLCTSTSTHSFSLTYAATLHYRRTLFAGLLCRCGWCRNSKMMAELPHSHSLNSVAHSATHSCCSAILCVLVHYAGVGGSRAQA